MKKGADARLGKPWRMSVLLVRDFVKVQTETKQVGRHLPSAPALGERERAIEVPRNIHGDVGA